MNFVVKSSVICRLSAPFILWQSLIDGSDMGCIRSLPKSAVPPASVKEIGGAGEKHETGQSEEHARYVTRKPKDPESERNVPYSDALPKTQQKRTKIEKKIVAAVYDYVANEDDDQSNGDLNFRKGDVMEIISEDEGWWLARNMKTKLQGYIPANYVVLYDGIEKNEWFHGGIDRKESERRLLAPGHIHGTFLIREGQQGRGDPGLYYVLSVLDEKSDVNANKAVKHYRVRPMDNSAGYYISPTIICQSIEHLVETYMEDDQGLCCKLTQPCPEGQPDRYDVSRDARDHWQIDRSNLTLNSCLGKGKFGEVWEGRWYSTSVAIKTFNKSTMDPDMFLAEAAIMKELRHPKLITLYAVCTEKQPFWIIIELMSKGNLKQYLQQNPEARSLTQNNLTDIAVQVAQGMSYMHSSNIIHRDLAARNILVGENNNVKIGDFGLAKLVESLSSLPEDKMLPIKWTAPEAIINRQFSFKSDVWSYGIFLVELITKGQTPYEGLGLNSSQLLSELEKGFRHPQPENCPDTVYEVMLFCWKRRPEDRPTFEHLADRMENLVDYTGDYQ